MTDARIVAFDAASHPLTEAALSAHRPLVVGRGSDCDVVLPSPWVSGRHLEVVLEEDGAARVRALGINGTYLNGVILADELPRPLVPGDTISVPGYTLRLAVTSPTGSVARSAEGMARLAERVAVLHRELLDRLQANGLAGLDLLEPEPRRRVEEILDDLVAGPLAVDSELAETATAEAFRRRLVDRYLGGEGDELARGSASARVTDWKRDPRHGLFEAMVEELLGDLAPRAAEGSPGERVRSLLGAFDDIYTARRDDVGPDLADLARRQLLRRELGDLVFGLGPLQDLLRLPHLEEVMVVGRDRIFVETSGGIEETGRAFPSDDALEVAIRRIVAPVGRFVNRSRPLVDARLPDGSRVNVVIPPVAVHGPSITIRKFRDRPLTPEDLVQLGTLDRRALSFLRAAVIARKNVIVSGGTGSGKTTLLNVLASQIPPTERIVVIEDSAELQLRQANLVVLEAKGANLEGEGAIPIRALVRNALRMRPERIVVGECRGSEALDMLQAMNTGHDGSLTTAHANSAAELMSRLEVMVLEAGQGLPLRAIQRQIAGALDLVVQIERQRDHVRRVVSITEVVAHDPEEERIVLEEIFRLSRRSGGGAPTLEFTGYLPSFLEEMFEAAGHAGTGRGDHGWLAELFWPAGDRRAASAEAPA